MIAYHLAQSALNHWQALTYLILRIILGSVYYDYLYFTNEEAEAYEN